MNHIYRTILDRLLDIRKVISRPGRTHGEVVPDGIRVMEGCVAFDRDGSILNVRQMSRQAIVEWKDFGIDKGERIVFRQPDESSSISIRAQGATPRRIDGIVEANGHFHLSGHGGIIIGSDGVISAAGFTADTLCMHDGAFKKEEDLRFLDDNRSGVFNLGNIQAVVGDVSLRSHLIRNDGVIRAVEGSVEMFATKGTPSASRELRAILAGVGGGEASIDATAVANTGLIEAAQAHLQVARGDLYTLAIDQSGVIHVTGTDGREGGIVLTSEDGTVRQDGVLAARNADGSGGEILVGGDYQGRNTAIANAGHAVVTSNARMDARPTGEMGNGGRIIVWADGGTKFAGRIDARGGEHGGDGGLVEVCGKRTLEFHPDAHIDLSAPKGKAGTVLLGAGEMTVLDTVTGAGQIAAGAIEAGLADANYIINTSNFDPVGGSGNISINSDVGWRNANTLTLRSGNSIHIDANITAPNGVLEMYAGHYAEAPLESGLINLKGGAWVTEGHVLQVSRLRYGANVGGFPSGYIADPDPHTANFWADGNLRINTLELDLEGGAGLSTLGNANAIGAFRTIGNGSLGWVSVTNHGGDLSLYIRSQDAFGMQIVTSGDLVLEAGSQVISTWSDIVLVSKGGNFINQTDGATLGFTRPNSKFLIYTGDRAGTVKGGVAGIEEFSCYFSANPPSDYGGGVSRFLYREKVRTFQ